MKKYNIVEKLNQIGYEVSDFALGDFDAIGELTAKKNRDPNSDLYKKVGCYFRPNYERGILLDALVKKFEISSFLEIGFGRGYSTFCVAKAMCDKGINGKITTVDPNLNEDYINNLTNYFPKEWFEKINFIKSTSENAASSLENDYDLILVDGDHTFDAVSLDWQITKSKFSKFIIFDDYHLPTKNSGPGIQVAKLIDSIEDHDKELIIMDRRIFLDDRGYTESEIDYGQVLIKNPGFDESKYDDLW